MNKSLIFISFLTSWASLSSNGYAKLINPEIPFQELATVLGAIPDGEGCEYSASELADADVEYSPTSAKSLVTPYWNCTMLKDNLDRDIMSDCRPPSTEVFFKKLPYPKHIGGDMHYLGFAPYPYSYSLRSTDDDKFEVTIRIRVRPEKKIKDADYFKFMLNIYLAEHFWHKYSPSERVNFRFIVERDLKNPDFDVALVSDDVRKPFNSTWSLTWDWHLLAHEIGHMMGLDDEYNQIRKTTGHIFGVNKTEWEKNTADSMNSFRLWNKCNYASLMCNSRNPMGNPQKYHYYLILRRYYCHVMPYDWSGADILIGK